MYFALQCLQEQIIKELSNQITRQETKVKIGYCGSTT